jgi:hypothetical protein
LIFNKGSLRIKFEDIAKAILKLDDKVLKQDILIALLELAPTQEEMDLCMNYKKEKKGDLKLLGNINKIL